MKNLWVEVNLGPKDLYPKDLIDNDKAKLAFSKFFKENFGKSFPLYQVYFLNFKGLSLELYSLIPGEFITPKVFTFSNSTTEKGEDFLGIKKIESPVEKIQISQNYRDKTLHFNLYKKTIVLNSLENVSNKNLPLQNFANNELGIKPVVPNLLGFLHDNFLKENNLSFNIKDIKEVVVKMSQEDFQEKAA